MPIGALLRLGGAVALLTAGLVHLDLYFGGYRSAGTEPDFGRSILFNAVASAIVAAAVAARREWFVRLAGIVLAGGSLAALAYTHTGHTFLGFSGDGLEPSPQAQIVIVAESLAVITLVVTFIPAVARDDRSAGARFLAAAGVVSAAALVGFGVLWAGDATTAASGPTSVAIAGFQFAPPELTVAAGSTVVWTNGDALTHSVSAGDGSFTSDRLEQGATYEHTFDVPGRYDYVCGVHPEMTATVTVTE